MSFSNTLVRLQELKRKGALSETEFAAAAANALIAHRATGEQLPAPPPSQPHAGMERRRRASVTSATPVREQFGEPIPPEQLKSHQAAQREAAARRITGPPSPAKAKPSKRRSTARRFPEKRTDTRIIAVSAGLLAAGCAAGLAGLGEALGLWTSADALRVFGLLATVGAGVVFVKTSKRESVDLVAPDLLTTTSRRPL